MELKTLGGLRLEGTQFSQPKPLLLLTYLNLKGSQVRKHLAKLFWPQGQRLKSLSMTLNRLKQQSGELVVSDNIKAWSMIPSDAQTLLQALDKSQWQRASETYSGAFLEGITLDDWSSELEEWVYTTREYLAERVQYALLNLAEEAAKRQDFAIAGKLAERAYRLPGLSSTDVNHLKRLYPLLSAGSSLLAPEVRKELDGYGISLVLSKDESKALFKPSSSSTLPKRVTSFIGRKDELIEINELFNQTQLLTLLGTAGVGKTRLAIQYAQQQTQVESVYFVPLETITSPEQIFPTILSTLGIKQENLDAIKQLVNFIGSKSILLVLDNLEQVAKGATLFSELLGNCPNLKVLVTSRERLGLAEEQLYPLEGLKFPKALVPTHTALEYDAIRLFFERAKRLQPHFNLSQALPEIIRICNILKGLPLGLELAVAWIRLMPCADIASEIEKNLDILESTLDNIPERQRSLRAAFEYSLNLLSDKEQALLSKLSVFRGGFRRDAATEIAGATLPLLMNLSNKSLLRVIPSGRFDIHPMLYQYLQEKLKPDQALSIQSKHLHFYLNLIQQQHSLVKSGKQAEVMQRLSEEWDNLQAVLERCLKHQQPHELLPFLDVLRESFEFKARFREGLNLLEQLSMLLKNTQPDNLRELGRLELEKAWFLFRLGDYEKAKQTATTGLQLMPTSDNERIYAGGLHTLGIIYMHQGDYGEALTYINEALDLATGSNHEGLTATILETLGVINNYQGHYETSENYFKQAIDLNQKLGNYLDQIREMGNLAISYALQQMPDKAESMLLETIKQVRVLDVKQTLPYDLSNLALLYVEKENYLKAHELNLEALDIANETNQSEIKTGILGSLINTSSRLGMTKVAHAYGKEALRASLVTQSHP